MTEIEITISTSNPQAELGTIIENYQKESLNSIRLQPVDWGKAWTEFLQMTLYGKGPVVSEVGTTWMSSLAGRNSLRPITNDELRKIGRPGSFPRSIWESCIDANTSAVVAIPWIVDTYLVYYRADIFEKYGIDEAGAFTSFDAFRATLATLKEKKTEAPIALTTAPSLSTTHNLASWIWGMGGDFVSKNGKTLTTMSPEAREGIYAFYELVQYLSPRMRGFTDDQCEDAFLRGETAILITNPSLLHRMKDQNTRPTFRSRIKTAIHPGVPVIGGSNLVIWKYIPPALEPQAIDFIRYMTDVDAQLAYFETSGMLPARVEAIQRLSQNPEYAPAFQSLMTGRDMPYIRLWGLIEDKLSQAFSEVWRTILASSNPDIKKIVEDTLKPVENRLNLTLAQ